MKENIFMRRIFDDHLYFVSKISGRHLVLAGHAEKNV